MQLLNSIWSLSAGTAMLRLWLGAMMIYHGRRKVFGDMDRFTEGVAEMGFPLPALFAHAAAYSEFLGGMLVIAGLFTRPALLMVFITMMVAALIRHWPDAFGKKELPLTFAVVSAALMALGPGSLSLDNLLARRAGRGKPEPTERAAKIPA